MPIDPQEIAIHDSARGAANGIRPGEFKGRRGKRIDRHAKMAQEFDLALLRELKRHRDDNDYEFPKELWSVIDRRLEKTGQTKPPAPPPPASTQGGKDNDIQATIAAAMRAAAPQPDTTPPPAAQSAPPT